MNQIELAKAKAQLAKMGFKAPEAKQHKTDYDALRKREYYLKTKRRRVEPLIFSFIPSPTVSDEPVYQAILNRGGIRYRSPRFSTVEQARKWRDQKLSELPECGSPIGRKILETISPQKEN